MGLVKALPGVRTLVKVFRRNIAFIGAPVGVRRRSFVFVRPAYIGAPVALYVAKYTALRPAALLFVYIAQAAALLFFAYLEQ